MGVVNKGIVVIHLPALLSTTAKQSAYTRKLWDKCPTIYNTMPCNPHETDRLRQVIEELKERLRTTTDPEQQFALAKVLVAASDVQQVFHRLGEIGVLEEVEEILGIEIPEIDQDLKELEGGLDTLAEKHPWLLDS